MDRHERIGKRNLAPMNPTDIQLKQAIFEATEQAARELFATGESFYYFALITSGEAHPPIVSAWSHEQLQKLPEGQRQMVKWSYADSPYFDFGSAYFSEVRNLFALRPILRMDQDARQAEYDLRLHAMEQALAELDSKGVFGTDGKRTQIVINAEVMPPDFTNTERAKRLNPASALVAWLKEVAE